MTRRRPGPAGAALAIACALTACGGGDDDADDTIRPLVDQIAPAMAAVDAARGGPQRYFEVNANRQFVNLFVADETGSQVQVYLYVDGELEPPTPAQAASGDTFPATAVDFDPDIVLAGIEEDLPDSDIVVFVVAAGPEGTVRYGADVQSDRGGTLRVDLAADGDVLAVDPAT